MSSQPNKPGSSGDPGSLAGKGWDILVGGKENLAASGGDDPFDIVFPPLSAVEGQAPANRDAEASAILQPGVTETASPSGVPVATGAPGVSAGVVVTPVSPPPPAPAAGGIMVEASVTSSAPAPMPQPSAAIPIPATPPAAPGASGIVELVPGGAPPQPVAPPAPSAVIPSVPAPRMTPAPMNVSVAAPIPPIAGVSGFGISAPFEVSDPFSTQVGLRVVVGDEKDLPTKPELEAQLVTAKRVDELWDEITETYDMVVNDVRGHYKTTDQALADLREARELLLAGKENFDNAERVLYAVKARLRLEEKVRQWSRTRGVWLVAYLVLWFLLLSLGTTATTKVAEVVVYFKLASWMGETYLPALMGAFGGVIGALWVLVKHTTRNRDFDPIHTLWYASNPFMGGALGVVTYFIMRGSGWLVTKVASGSDFTLTPPVALSLYAICIVVGFNQNILWALIDRFIKAIFPQKEEESKAATDKRPETASGEEAKRLQG